MKEFTIWLTVVMVSSNKGFGWCVGEEVGVSGSWILLVLGFEHCVRRMMNWVLKFLIMDEEDYGSQIGKKVVYGGVLRGLMRERRTCNGRSWWRVVVLATCEVEDNLNHGDLVVVDDVLMGKGRA
ncbi:hypothetical protein V8G54_006884 [Vigna mungo]|uniref:Uncharacterized protein n=1 Tax=Vigna mungo TaxID=3915 RepID=A0AAQ3S6U8_VIGMU